MSSRPSFADWKKYGGADITSQGANAQPTGQPASKPAPQSWMDKASGYANNAYNAAMSALSGINNVAQAANNTMNTVNKTADNFNATKDRFMGKTGGANIFQNGVRGGSDRASVVKYIADYNESVAATTKENVIMMIAKAMREMGLKKIDLDAPNTMQLAASVINALNELCANKFSKVKEDQIKACVTIANTLNKQFTPDKHSAQLFDIKLDRDGKATNIIELYNQMAQWIYSFITGVHEEFSSTFAGLQAAMSQNAALVVADSYKATDVADFATATKQELSSQSKMFDTMVNSILTSTKAYLDSVADPENISTKLAEMRKKTKELGKTAFSEGISMLLSAISTYVRFVAEANSALEEISVLAIDHLKSAPHRKFATLLGGYETQKTKSHHELFTVAKTLKSNLKAPKTQQRTTYHGGSDDGGDGGDDNAENRVYKHFINEIAARRKTIEEFMDKISAEYKKLISIIQKIGPQFGNEIEVSEDLDLVDDVIRQLRENLVNCNKIELILIGARDYNNTESKIIKDDFLNNMRILQKYCQHIINTDSQSAPYFTEFYNQIKQILLLITSYEQTLQNSYSGEKMLESSDGVAGNINPTSTGLDPVSFLKRNTLDINEFEIINGKPFKVVTLIFEQALHMYSYYYYLAYTKKNMKFTSKQLKDAKNQYADKVLGPSIAEIKYQIKKRSQRDFQSLELHPETEKEKRAQLALQYESVSNFYNVVQAIDLYLMEYTFNIADNYETIHKLSAELSNVEIITDWFAKQSIEALNNLSPKPSGEDTATVTFKDQVKNLEKFFNNFQGIKNLFNIFTRIGGTESTVFMKPSEMYEGLLNFIKSTSINLSTNKLFFKKDLINVIDNAYQHMYSIICAIGGKIISAIKSHNLFYDVNLFTTKNTPLPSLSLHRIILGGSLENTPVIIPDAAELYFRLIKLAELYKELFSIEISKNQDDSMDADERQTIKKEILERSLKITEIRLLRAANAELDKMIKEQEEDIALLNKNSEYIISCIPGRNDKYFKFLHLIFNSAGELGYNADEMNLIIFEINKIYNNFPTSKNKTIEIIMDFVEYINKSYGVIKKVNIMRFMKFINNGENGNAEDNIDSNTNNFSILLGESELSTKSTPPSEKFLKSPPSLFLDIDEFGHDKRADSELLKITDSATAIITNFANTITNVFKNSTSSNSFRYMLRNLKLDLESTPEPLRMGKVLSAINTPVAMTGEIYKKFMVHELVVTNVEILNHIVLQIKNLNIIMEDVDKVLKNCDMVELPSKSLLLSLYGENPLYFIKYFIDDDKRLKIPNISIHNVFPQIGEDSFNYQRIVNYDKIIQTMIDNLFSFSSSNQFVNINYEDSKININFTSLLSYMKSLLYDIKLNSSMLYPESSKCVDLSKNIEYLQKEINKFAYNSLDNMSFKKLNNKIAENFKILTSVCFDDNDDKLRDPINGTYALAEMIWYESVCDSGYVGVSSTIVSTIDPSTAIGNILNVMLGKYAGDWFYINPSTINGSSILLCFNKIIETYLELIMDKTNGSVVYSKLIDNLLTNSTLAVAVSDIHMSIPNMTIKNNARFDFRHPPHPESLLFESTANCIIFLKSAVRQNGVPIYLKNTLMDVSTYTKELLISRLPVIIKMLDAISAKCNFLLDMVNEMPKLFKDDIGVNKATHAFLGDYNNNSTDPDRIKKGPYSDNPAERYLMESNATERHTWKKCFSPLNFTKAYVKNILTNLSNTSANISKNISESLKEIGPIPSILNLSTDFNSFYKTKNKTSEDPLTPFSFLMAPVGRTTLCNGVYSNTIISFDSRTPNSSDTKFLTGISKFLMLDTDLEIKPDDLSIENFNKLIENYNNTVMAIDRINSSSSINSFIKSMKGINWLYNTTIFNPLMINFTATCIPIAQTSVNLFILKNTKIVDTIDLNMTSATGPTFNNSIKYISKFNDKKYGITIAEFTVYKQTIDNKLNSNAIKKISTYGNLNNFSISNELVNIIESKNKIQGINIILVPNFYNLATDTINLLVKNILDLRIIPITITGMLKDIALSNIILYAAGFKQFTKEFIVEYFSKTDGSGKLKNKEGYVENRPTLDMDFDKIINGLLTGSFFNNIVSLSSYISLKDNDFSTGATLGLDLCTDKYVSHLVTNEDKSTNDVVLYTVLASWINQFRFIRLYIHEQMNVARKSLVVNAGISDGSFTEG